MKVKKNNIRHNCVSKLIDGLTTPRFRLTYKQDPIAFSIGGLAAHQPGTKVKQIALVLAPLFFGRLVSNQKPTF